MIELCPTCSDLRSHEHPALPSFLFSSLLHTTVEVSCIILQSSGDFLSMIRNDSTRSSGLKMSVLEKVVRSVPLQRYRVTSVFYLHLYFCNTFRFACNNSLFLSFHFNFFLSLVFRFSVLLVNGDFVGCKYSVLIWWLAVGIFGLIMYSKGYKSF